MKLTSFASMGLIVVTALVAHAGTVAPEQKDWYEKYRKQVNVPKPEAMLLNTDLEPNTTEGFKPLFNGKDLTGWKIYGGESRFEAVDGVITGTCVADTPSTYLCTERDDFTDFIFTCEIKWVEDINSGVMFRSKAKSAQGVETAIGPQAEMEGSGSDRGWSGGIYGQGCGGYFYPLWLEEHQTARRALDTKGWNRLTIQSEGNTIKTWVNGIPAAHWIDDGTYAKGFFGFQVHKAKRGVVQFRNIRIKEKE